MPPQQVLLDPSGIASEIVLADALTCALDSLIQLRDNPTNPKDVRDAASRCLAHINDLLTAAIH